MEKYFRGKNGQYYTAWQIARSLEIVYGHQFSVNNENDVEELINTNVLKGIEPGEQDPSIEELIRSGSKVYAVKKYYNDFNKNHPDIGISLKDAKAVVDKIEINMKKEENKKESD